MKTTYLVGSSGSGKSTLAAALAKQFGHAVIDSPTTAIAARLGMWAKIMADPAKTRAVQWDIWLDLVARLEAAIRAGRPFVADRSIDKAAYTYLMTGDGPKLTASRAYRWLVDQMTDHNSVVAFLRPVPAILEAARATDGGRRNVFLSDPWVYRVDGVIEVLLKQAGVRYVEITGGTVGERVAAII